MPKLDELIYLICLGQKEEVERLLAKGCNINDQDEYGNYALLAAVNRGDLDMVQLLISYGAKVDLMDDIGRTPLSCAKRGGYSAIVQLIESTPAIKNGENKSKPSSQQLSSIASPPTFLIDDSPLCERQGWNNLLVAIYRGDLLKVKKIVKKDKNSIRHRDKLGNNALLLAASYGRKEIFDWLTSSEAADLMLDEKELKLDICNTEGHTPFLAAVRGGRLEFVKNLLHKNSEFFNQTDKFGKGAIEIANFYDHRNISTFLLGYN